MSAVQFDQLNLSKPILRALEEEGYATPTPIQARAIPLVLSGKDLIATAQTGTGKTAAFSLPLLQRLDGTDARKQGPRALVLTPTRELALQIEQSVGTYGRHLRLSAATILGGVNQKPQIKALRRNPEIVVATPGRLLDLIGQGHVHFEGIEFLVLDEADRMLDMGFIRDVRRIIDMLPRKRQSLLFSATLPREIADLASSILHEPASVSVAPDAAVADNIVQQVMYVNKQNKKDLLAEVLRDEGVSRALVFTRTKHRANRVAKLLERQGISADAIHSSKSQNARQRALAAFDGGSTRVLVATDIVARGIDVEDISHVINFELPNEPESYVHRIGRTARAGSAGTALSFCNEEEVTYLNQIERLTHTSLTPVDGHPFHEPAIAAMRTGSAAPGARKAGRRADQPSAASGRVPSRAAARRESPRQASSGRAPSERAVSRQEPRRDRASGRATPGQAGPTGQPASVATEAGRRDSRPGELTYGRRRRPATGRGR